MTNSAKHTPGPWGVAFPIVLTFPGDAHRREDAYEIQTEDGGTTLCYAVGSDADVRLIVAAPDLLAALRDCADRLERVDRIALSATGGRYDGPLGEVTRARAAIAKAEGGAR